MNCKKSLILYLFIFTATVLNGQTASLDGFRYFSPRSISPIFDGKESKGYTMFYKADKADKKNDNYDLVIYDENLTKVKTITVKKPRDRFALLGNCFNGSEIGFYFYNDKEDQFEIESYDESLTKTGSRIIKEELTNVEKSIMMQNQESAEKDEGGGMAAEITLYPVPGKGFIRNGILKNGSGFKLEMLDNKLKTVWKHQTPEKSDDYEMFMVYETTPKYFIGTTIRRPGMLSKKMTFFITAFNIETGKIALEVPVETPGSKDQLSMNTIKYDSVENKIIVFGDYYDEKDKPGVSKSKGFYIKSFTMDGKELEKKFYSWDKDMKSLLPAEAKASLDKGAMNFIHRALKGKDGKYFLICEQFTKATDAAGIAGKMLGGMGAASASKVVVWNMIIYVLNADFSIAEVKFYPKDKSDVTLPAGGGSLSAGMLGMLTKVLGGFDYQFTQLTNDGSSYDVVYIDYDKEKGESTKRILGNIIISQEGKFTLDKMDITSKATASYLYPAKPGYLMMVDYLKKEKTLGMKMVKLNY
jgi:hypothetical protein